MKSGRIFVNDTPNNSALRFDRSNIPMSFPAAVQLYCRLNNSKNNDCPLNNKAGREFLQKQIVSNIGQQEETIRFTTKINEPVLEVKDLYYKSDRYSPDILKGLSLCLHKSEIYTLFGGNGAGKTTLLKAISGLIKPYSGTIKILGKNIKKYSKNKY